MTETDGAKKFVRGVSDCVNDTNFIKNPHGIINIFKGIAYIMSGEKKSMTRSGEVHLTNRYT